MAAEAAFPSGQGGGAAPAPALAPAPRADDRNALQKCSQCLTNCIKDTAIEKMMAIVKVFNLINAAAMILAAVWGYINISSAIFVVYLATYVGCFGLLLIAFELRIKRYENRMKRAFGFMFSPWGRFLFLLFCTSLLFGIDLWLPILIGVFTLINAIFQCFIICSHPDFKKYAKVETTANPADLPEDQITAYLKAHPELVSQALNQSTGQFPQSSGGGARAPAPLPRPNRPAASAPPARSAPPPVAPRGAEAANPFDQPSGPPPVAARPAPGARQAPPPVSDNPFDN